MNYIVTVFNTLSNETQRRNFDNLDAAVEHARKARLHPRVRKVEIALILAEYRGNPVY